MRTTRSGIAIVGALWIAAALVIAACGGGYGGGSSSGGVYPAPSPMHSK